MALVVRHASWIWEQRTSLGRLQRAWAIITEKLVERPSRASASRDRFPPRLSRYGGSAGTCGTERYWSRTRSSMPSYSRHR
eukprot:108664-Pyramimonas_sp.AAC.1